MTNTTDIRAIDISDRVVTGAATRLGEFARSPMAASSLPYAFYDDIQTLVAYTQFKIAQNNLAAQLAPIVAAARVLLERGLVDEHDYFDCHDCDIPLTRSLQQAFADADIEVVYQREAYDEE